MCFKGTHKKDRQTERERGKCHDNDHDDDTCVSASLCRWELLMCMHASDVHICVCVRGHSEVALQSQNVV